MSGDLYAEYKRALDPYDLPAFVCPHPEKNWYRSKRHAKLVLRRQRGVPRLDSIHVYRCVCGGFHLGHKLARQREGV
jgi:hypothetical protein